MSTRKSMRRSLLIAAVTAACSVPSVHTIVASDSGIEQVQYQPGQQGQSIPNPNSAVSQELKRMFEESGRPMPPMNPSQLPNAQAGSPQQQPAQMQGQAQHPQLSNPQMNYRPAGSAAPVSPQNGQFRQPNAQQMVQQPPAGRTNATPVSQAVTQPTQKKNAIQKFFGRLTGQDKKQPEASVTPPVPPGYQEPAAVPPASGQQFATPNGGMQNNPAGNRTSAGQQFSQGARSNASAAPQGMVSQPGVNAGQQGINGRMAPGQMANGQYRQGQPMTSPVSGQQSLVNGSASGMQNRATNPAVGQPNHRPVSPVANGSGVVRMNSQPRSQNPAIAQRPALPTPPAPAVPPVLDDEPSTDSFTGNQTPSSRFIQPGAAPSFMQGSDTRSSAAAAAAGVRNANPSTSATAQAVAPANDDFVDPFGDADMEDADSDPLDLEALSVPATDAPVVAAQPDRMEAPVESNTVVEPGPRSSISAADENESAVEELPLPAVEDRAEGAAEPAENPFTGVQLNESELNAFQPPAEALDVKAPFAEPEPEGGESFGEPAPPMEDFETNLPLITLPPAGPVSTEAVSAESQTSESLESTEAEAAPAATPTIDVSPLSPTPQPSTDAQSRDVAEKADKPTARDEKWKPMSDHDRRERQLEQIQSRKGQAGFKGFCPVALRDRRELVDAKPEFNATFGLQKYSFSSPAARAAFEADPARYAPAGGGNDVVLMVTSGEEQSGQLEYALWYRDRLYLFHSRETLTLFNQDPQKFANQY
jgi:YHS domain-containing protein